MRQLLLTFGLLAVASTLSGQSHFDIDSPVCTNREMFPSARGCWVIITSVSHGDYALDGEPGCPAGFEETNRQLLDVLKTAEAAKSAPPVVAALAVILSAVRGGIGGEVGKVLDGITGGERFASCRTFGMSFPQDTRFARRNDPQTGRPEHVNAYDTFSDERNWYGPVGFGAHNGDGWKRIQSAGIEPFEGGYIIRALVKNWSHNHSVDAKLVIFVE